MCPSESTCSLPWDVRILSIITLNYKDWVTKNKIVGLSYKLNKVIGAKRLT